MYIVNFWHTVSDYAEWKKMFDSDPLGREESGVRRYSIERPLDDGQTVIGELEFDDLGKAETFARRLQELWKGPGGRVATNTGLRITELLEQERFDAGAGRRAA